MQSMQSSPPVYRHSIGGASWLFWRSDLGFYNQYQFGPEFNSAIPEPLPTNDEIFVTTALIVF